MSLVSQLTLAFQRVGTEFKTIRGQFAKVTVVQGFTRTAVEAAIAAVPANGTIWFPDGGFYDWTGDLVFDAAAKPGLTLAGPGTIRGTIKIGTGSQAVGTKIEARYKLLGLNFRRELDTTTYPGASGDGITAGSPRGYAAGSTFVKLDRVRTVEIAGCDFWGAAYPISIVSNVLCGQHELSAIRIHGNDFGECDEAWHLEYDAASPGGWQCVGDSAFIGNTVNRSYVRMVGLAAIDGIHIADNVSFMINYSGTGYTNQQFKRKRQNIWIGESGWAKIVDNKLFEAGYESILVDKAHNVITINGNECAWPGQVVPSDAMRVLSASGAPYGSGAYPELVCLANVGERYSKSLLSVTGDWVSINLGPNSFQYDTTISGSAVGRYIGTTETTTAQRQATLAALGHYRYDLSGLTYPKAPQVGIAGVASDRADSSDKFAGHTYTTYVQSLSGVTALGLVHGAATVPTSTFVAGTAKDVVQVRGSAEAFSIWSGTISVTAEPVGGTKQAKYELVVSKSAAGLNLLQMGSLPDIYTAGTNADDPAFSWDVNANGLVATPVGATAGAFLFTFYFTGDLIVG